MAFPKVQNTDVRLRCSLSILLFATTEHQKTSAFQYHEQNKLRCPRAKPYVEWRTFPQQLGFACRYAEKPAARAAPATMSVARSATSRPSDSAASKHIGMPTVNQTPRAPNRHTRLDAQVLTHAWHNRRKTGRRPARYRHDPMSIRFNMFWFTRQTMLADPPSLRGKDDHLSHTGFNVRGMSGSDLKTPVLSIKACTPSKGRSPLLFIPMNGRAEPSIIALLALWGNFAPTDLGECRAPEVGHAPPDPP